MWAGFLCSCSLFERIQICNYCLSSFLFVHSFPSVSMVTWTASISIRILFVSCSRKSVTSNCRFCYKPQTFFPAKLLCGYCPVIHQECFRTEKRQLCWSCPFPEEADSFLFLQRSLNVTLCSVFTFSLVEDPRK